MLLSRYSCLGTVCSHFGKSCLSWFIPGDLCCSVCGSRDHRGERVSASDGIERLPSECLESRRDCPAAAQVNIFQLCPQFSFTFHPIYTLATRRQCPLLACGVNVSNLCPISPQLTSAKFDNNKHYQFIPLTASCWALC